MIFYELERKRPAAPTTAPPPSGPTGNGLFQKWKDKRRTPPTAGFDARPYVPEELAKVVCLHGEVPDIPPIAMGKLQYAQWLNAYVYPTFPKGQLVTIASQPHEQGKAPKVWFKVVEIQEIHYVVQMDKSTRQPKAVGIALQGSAANEHIATFPVWYSPKLLRVLQPDEREAIDRLRDQASSGRNGAVASGESDTGNDGYAG